MPETGLIVSQPTQPTVIHQSVGRLPQVEKHWLRPWVYTRPWCKDSLANAIAGIAALPLRMGRDVTATERLYSQLGPATCWDIRTKKQHHPAVPKFKDEVVALPTSIQTEVHRGENIISKLREATSYDKDQATIFIGKQRILERKINKH